LSASDSARTLLEQALDRQAMLDMPGAIDLARRAREADQRFLAAHWLYMGMLAQEGRRDEARRYYAGRATANREMACLAIAADLPANGPGSEAPRLVALARQQGAGGCVALWLPDLIRNDRDLPGLPATLDLRRHATRAAPMIARPWEALATSLATRGDTAAADSVLKLALVAVRHPLERLSLLAQRASLAPARIAEARWSALRLAVQRDGRPGMRLRLYNTEMTYRSSLAVPPVEGADIDGIVRGGSPGIRSGHAVTHAFMEVARGDYVSAIPFFDTALRIADSMPDKQNAVAVGLAKGRALSKMGQLQDAERTLMTAYRRARGTNQRYSLAEIWHNLSHTYEGLGQREQAVAASDSFVATAAALDADPIRIISRRDAGMLRLTLGWHAAARVQFDAMVRHIDAERQNHYWAGEYYERIGDARAAIAFFQRGATIDKGERSLNLAGLARAYEALGMPDSAAAAAIDHDRYINTPTEVALAPEVLSRLGKHDEAIRLAQEWARRRESGGSVQGAALARMQVARLELVAGRNADARDAARAALRHATSLHLATERIEALRLIGLSDQALGRPRDAVLQLREAAALADRVADLRIVREAYSTLADLHAELGATDSAFAAWDRAARAVENGAAALSDDLDRARFRAAHLAPFDAALQYALRLERDADNPERLARWSARRKAAAILLTARGVPAPSDGAPARGLASIRARLAADHAIVDWILLPDLVAALVVRQNESRLVRLAIVPDSVTAVTKRLTLPFARRGRSVDLARAVFDTAAAAALYNALIAPLRPMLAGVRRLTLVPDGPLHHVPFATLLRHDSTQVRYLLDDFELDHALSLAAVNLDGPRDWRGAATLAVMTDVPGGDAEREAIRASWPRGAVRELVGAAASERAVRRSVRDAGIVHFATHAEASDRDPLTTHMRLAAVGGDDGLLHLREIEPRSYAGRLVVLASCESLVGPLLMGEGFVGLSRAFVSAGAAGVVATRWPIGPASASFSRVFYDALGRGQSFSAAPREAQLRLRDRPATSNPFFWGGYVAVEGVERAAQFP
jgi:CHAT domain-containing protein